MYNNSYSTALRLPYLTTAISQIQKYTAFSNCTRITKNNQTINHKGYYSEEHEWAPTFLTKGLAVITQRSTAFVAERKWQHHDTVSSLALALCSEAGELADVVAWTTKIKSVEDLYCIQDRIAQELADVTILLVRFAKINEIDLPKVIRQPQYYATYEHKVLRR